MATVAETDASFTLGAPALICRWRLAGGVLPMENRHLRALGNRVVNGASVKTELVAWAKQHMEWDLKDGSAAHPDGVLMLVVDTAGRAAMTVGPYEPLKHAGVQALVGRAEQAELEASELGVAPETIWAYANKCLYFGLPEGSVASGTATLVEDLARTLGIRLELRPNLGRELRAGLAAEDEVFLVSDEHGVVPATDASGSMGERFKAGYERLLAKQRQADR